MHATRQGSTSRKHVLIGFVHGADREEDSASGGETTIYSGGESSAEETESIYQLQDGRLGGYSGGDSIPNPYEPLSRDAIFMVGTQPILNSSTAAAMRFGSTAAVIAEASSLV